MVSDIDEIYLLARPMLGNQAQQKRSAGTKERSHQDLIIIENFIQLLNTLLKIQWLNTTNSMSTSQALPTPELDVEEYSVEYLHFVINSANHRKTLQCIFL